MAHNAIVITPWGTLNGKEIKMYTLVNENNQEVDILNYGATIQSVRTPDRNGHIQDVVLGFDDIEGYIGQDNPYFGATVGRVANRIGRGRFFLDGKEINVSKNNGENTLHGGFKGWNAKIWESTISNNSVIMSLLSEDGDEGFPGAVIATVIFTLDNDGSLVIKMKACTTRTTPINLTNHSYFNLAGHNANYTELYKHSVMLNADRWTVTDASSIPTGEIKPVDKTIMDLRTPTILGDVINKVPGGGYDNNFCLVENKQKDKQLEQLAAKVTHLPSGRTLEVYTNQPGIQFYTGNGMPEKGTKGIIGKNDTAYFKHGAMCLETQIYPDAVNHANFPNSVVKPGDRYCHVLIYKFGVESQMG